MPEATPAPSGRAVFLSYAREDAEAARRIADALRAFGVEAWFDQSELRGGDAWDQKIKRQIRECALFMPLISATTQGRGEGYFRREWKLGVERTHDMAAGVAFIVPVVIDDTPESAALVPEEFMRVQWTRLPHGVPSPEFVTQVKRLMESPRTPAPAQPPQASARSTTGGFPPVNRGIPGWAWGALAVIAVGVVAALYLGRRPEAVMPPKAEPAPAAAAAPTPVPTAPEVSSKSIAVLPFANFSTDKDNEFFADGLQDEVITALAKIHDLKVISRTSTMAYKNPEGRNLKKIAGELGVATVLEGSVQRMGSKVHLNVQLIDARTDQHLWADSYTEDLTDVFAMESSLAGEVVGALKASFTSDEKALLARRPTQDVEAFDLYLQGRALYEKISITSSVEYFDRIAHIFEQAAARDPSFLLPHVAAANLHGEAY
jgi:TolB-like protein